MSMQLGTGEPGIDPVGLNERQKLLDLCEEGYEIMSVATSAAEVMMTWERMDVVMGEASRKKMWTDEELNAWNYKFSHLAMDKARELGLSSPEINGEFELTPVEKMEMESLQDRARKQEAQVVFIRGVQEAINMGRCESLLDVFKKTEDELIELYDGAMTRHNDLSKLFYLLDLRLKQIVLGNNES